MTAPPTIRPRGIAYVLTHYPRVTQTFIAQEIDALRAAGVTVQPMAMNVPTGVDADHPEAATTIYLKRQSPLRVIRSLASALGASPAGFLRTAWQAWRSSGTDIVGMGRRLAHFVEAVIVWDESRRRDLDHIHAHFGQTPSTIAWLAAELGRRAGAGPQRWTFTVHCASEVYDRRSSLPAHKLASADAAICVTDHTRSQVLLASDPAHWDRARVVRVGIDLDRHPLRDTRPLGSPARVLIVGRIDPAKAHSVLIEAMAVLRGRGVDVVLDIVGDGSWRDEMVDLVVRLGLDEAVTFVGEVPPAAVAPHLEQADVFCLPSFDEGLPVAMMEAMAVGVPVVTSYIAGIPELAVDRETAMVVPAGNVDALAGAIQELLGDSALRAKLVTAARDRVTALHDHRRTLPAFGRVLGVETIVP